MAYSTRRQGFTIIEIVIAIALTALIVTAVFVATNSMATVARRQCEEGVQASRLSRFLEIFNRDVRGWSVAPATPAAGSTLPPAPLPNTTVLLDISTTADGLSQVLQNYAETRAIRVQYACRTYLGGFEIVRLEFTGLGIPMELSLVNLAQPAQIEFFANSSWSTTPPQGSRRPKMVRLILDGTVVSTQL